MNLQRCLIRKLMLYEFELGHNTAGLTIYICCVKGECVVDPSTATKCFKKFLSGCKNHDKTGKVK